MNLYRYDIATETLSFIAQTDGTDAGEQHLVPTAAISILILVVLVVFLAVRSTRCVIMRGLRNLMGIRCIVLMVLKMLLSVCRVRRRLILNPRTGAFYGVDQGSGTLDTQDGAPGKVVFPRMVISHFLRPQRH